MDSIISTFHIDWKIIIAQAINFAVVFVVLYIFALKPLAKLMAERSEKIAKGIDDAKTNAALLLKAQAEYDTALQKARAEANKIFEEGKKEAEENKVKMLEDAKNQVYAMMESGKSMLQVEKVKMVADAKKEIVGLIIAATEKLVGSKMDEAFNEKTVSELKNL